MRHRKNTAKRGRPRKFAEPSHPITVTLPGKTLRQLARINKDRARAIVGCIQSTIDMMEENRSLSVEIIQIDCDRGLIIIGSNRYIEKLDCIRMLEIVPGRNLICIKPGTPVSLVELNLCDLLDTIPQTQTRERSIVAELIRIFRQTRRTRTMHKEEIFIVPLRMQSGKEAAE